MFDLQTNRRIRLPLLLEIEEARHSKVIVYFTGDRGPLGSRIAEDAIRPIYEHLISVGSSGKRRIDLFLYSRGGDVSVPWRIVTMIREFCDEFNVLVPYKAQSAATLLSLGADHIVMGKKAELGPIDPTLVKATLAEGATPPKEISVEDVNSFISFVRERSNINDQNALAQMVKALIDEVGPLALGSVNRQNSHIRLVARKMMMCCKDNMGEERVNAIIDTLTQKMYSHGHGIGRREAKSFELPVIFPPDNLEALLWRLYSEYETTLALNEPIDPDTELATSEHKIIDGVPIAVIESAAKLHSFKTNIEFRKERQVPPNIAFNLSFQLPPNLPANQLPQQTQQLLQQLVAQVSKDVAQLVQSEIARQSRVLGISFRTYGGKWEEERQEVP